MSVLNKKIERRTVVKGFLIAGPTLAVAGRLGFADGAGAFPTKTDELPDAQDFTDIFVVSQQPTIYDLKIEIRPDNRVYAEGPRQDIGQGILTTFAMMVADNLDVPFDNMDVICPRPSRSGARPRSPVVRTTPASCGTRSASSAPRCGASCWPPVRSTWASRSPSCGPRTATSSPGTAGRSATASSAALAASLPKAPGGAAEDGQGLQDHRQAPDPAQHPADRPGQGALRHGPALLQGVPADRRGHGRDARRFGGLDRRLGGQEDPGRHRRHPHPGHARLPDPRGRGGHGRDLRYRQEGQERAQDQVERRPDGPVVRRPDRRRCSTGSSTRSPRPAKASRPRSAGPTCPTPRWRRTPPSPTSKDVGTRSGAAPRCPPPCQRHVAETLGMKVEQVTYHVHPGRWRLRPSPVPRPGRPRRPRSPSGSASRSSCSGCGKRASSTAVPARSRSTRSRPPSPAATWSASSTAWPARRWTSATASATSSPATSPSTTTRAPASTSSPTPRSWPTRPARRRSR